jgi:hypothetical protein
MKTQINRCYIWNYGKVFYRLECFKKLSFCAEKIFFQFNIFYKRNSINQIKKDYSIVHTKLLF